MAKVYYSRTKDVKNTRLKMHITDLDVG